MDGIKRWGTLGVIWFRCGHEGGAPMMKVYPCPPYEDTARRQPQASQEEYPLTILPLPAPWSLISQTPEKQMSLVSIIQSMVFLYSGLNRITRKEELTIHRWQDLIYKKTNGNNQKPLKTNKQVQ